MKGPPPSSSYAAVQSLKPAVDLGPRKDVVLDVFFVFHIIGGHAGLPLALATMAIMKTVARRHPTLINLLVSWFVYATANLLLLYSGEARKTDPDFAVCLTQASMIYGSTVGVAAATLSLVLQLWMEFRGMKLAKDARAGSLINMQLLLLPWAGFILITIGSAAFGVKHPSLVSIRWQFYCTLSSSAIIYTVSASTLVLLALTLGFQASVLRTLFKASRQFRAVNRSSYQIVLRVGIFSIYSGITFIVSIVITFRPTFIFGYIFVSTLPLAAFLVFGTQEENLRFWFRVVGRRKTEGHVPLTPIAFKSNTSTDHPPGSAPPFESDLNCNTDKPVPKSPNSSSAANGTSTEGM